MNLNSYELDAGQNLTTFEFLSEGPRGQIKKIIQFQVLNYAGLYNLAFGDFDSATATIDDQVVTDNADTEKVLATVAAAVYAFADYYPEAWIYATGSISTRTRLYRMGLNKYLATAAEDFDIMGRTTNGWEWYVKGRDYQAFAVRRKIK